MPNSYPQLGRGKDIVVPMIKHRSVKYVGQRKHRATYS